MIGDFERFRPYFKGKKAGNELSAGLTRSKGVELRQE